MFDTLPIWVLIAFWLVIIVASVEVGYRLGVFAHSRSDDEKESPVGVISGTILALLAFVLAFTFGIVSNRYDARKALVRDHANAIGTTYLRADFLPEPDRQTTKELFLELVDIQLGVTASSEIKAVEEMVPRANAINGQLWDMAVAYGKLDLNSDVGSLYIDSLNESIDILANRVSIGIYARIPGPIWFMLGLLLVLAMIGIGYQTGIAASKRSWSALMLAVSFTIVIGLIIMLDRPDNRILTVPQQPFESLQQSITADLEQYQ